MDAVAVRLPREGTDWWTAAALSARLDTFTRCSRGEGAALPEARAIVFDLDDTLYPYRAFVRSGFRAVACRLAEECGLAPSRVVKILLRALRTNQRGRELQDLCDRLALPTSLATDLSTVIREHCPSLRLPRESANVLTTLRGSWRIGVLTNGAPHIQRRKIAALGLSDVVNAVVFASECGGGTGKPDAAAFQTVLERLATVPAQSVFVGDDPTADIEGAAAVGMKTIHILNHSDPDERCVAPCCRIHVRRLDLVPTIADKLVPLSKECHVF